jgi:hypothetical protein
VSAGAHDRRCAERRRDEHGILGARVRPGHDVAVVDVSATGILVETDRRLLPGAPVEMQIETTARTVNVRGRVVRCAVARLRPTLVCYRGAIAFERCLPWFVPDRSGYHVPSTETTADLLGGVAPTLDRR